MWYNFVKKNDNIIGSLTFTLLFTTYMISHLQCNNSGIQYDFYLDLHVNLILSWKTTWIATFQFRTARVYAQNYVFSIENL